MKTIEQESPVKSSLEKFSKYDLDDEYFGELAMEEMRSLTRIQRTKEVAESVFP